MKRGQAAMEFIMTYGWAILVVLAAIGALAYFGVLNPRNFVPDKCMFPAGLTCTEKPVFFDDGDNIDIVLANGLPEDIQIRINQDIGIIRSDQCVDAQSSLVQVTVRQQDGSFIAYDNPADIAPVETEQPFIIRIHCPGLSMGKKVYADISFFYETIATGASHSVVGEISGKVG
ncbi:MAG: hypothetical protein V1735_07790 [Nanoarchaeota archaeon]